MIFFAATQYPVLLLQWISGKQNPNPGRSRVGNGLVFSLKWNGFLLLLSFFHTLPLCLQERSQLSVFSHVVMIFHFGDLGGVGNIGEEERWLSESSLGWHPADLCGLTLPGLHDCL